MPKSLAARTERLRREAREHKRLVWYHRRALGAVMAELAEIDALTSRLGATLTVVDREGDITPDGEGDIHGRRDAADGGSPHP